MDIDYNRISELAQHRRTVYVLQLWRGDSEDQLDIFICKILFFKIEKQIFTKT